MGGPASGRGWPVSSGGHFCLFPTFWLHHAVCRVSVPGPGVAPTCPAVEARHPDHWASREAPTAGHPDFLGSDLWLLPLLPLLLLAPRRVSIIILRSIHNVTCVCSPFFCGNKSVFGASQVARVVKNPPPSAGEARDSIPGPGGHPGARSGTLLQYSFLENPTGRRARPAPVRRVAKSRT